MVFGLRLGQNIQVSERAINVLLLLGIIYLCEVVFTESTIIKIRIMMNPEKQ